MAKINIDPLAKTDNPKEAKQPQEPDVIKSRGVGLSVSEWAELDAIAAEKNISPHALRAAAVRYFADQYKAGAVEITSQVIGGKIHVKAEPKR